MASPRTMIARRDDAIHRCANSHQRMVISRQCVAQSRARLRRIRRRRIAGGSHDDLHAWVRESLARGVLLPVDGTSWIGRGTGAACAVCEHPIHADETEHEVILPRRARAHSRCYAIWFEESKVFQPPTAFPDR